MTTTPPPTKQPAPKVLIARLKKAIAAYNHAIEELDKAAIGVLVAVNVDGREKEKVLHATDRLALCDAVQRTRLYP